MDPRILLLQARLESHRPRVMAADASTPRASVALLVRPAPADLEILLIQRSTSAHDRWSGHMALPGGRREDGESDLDAAIRETLEEVGVDLTGDAMLLGRLDDVRPRSDGPRIAVAPFVFGVPLKTRARPAPAEVADTVWIPVRHLTDPRSAAEYPHVMPGGARFRFPAFSYNSFTIWGLTHRMLSQFLEIARTLLDGEAT